MQTPPFAKTLFKCDDPTSLKLENGNRFIRKLPDDRSLGYLHKLFTPLDDAGLESLHQALEQPLPADFTSFLQWSNGACLFDNKIYLFGLIGSLSRDLSPEKQQPISIDDNNRIFAATNGARWAEGWRVIGSVVGWSSSYAIELHRDGRCAITSEQIARSMPSFTQCLSTVIDRVDACFSCDGIIDRSHAELESALAILVRPQ